MKKSVLVGLIVAVIVVIAGCEILVPGDPGTVAVTGVTLDASRLVLEEHGTATLAAAVFPAEAADKAVTWASDNEEVATVDQTGVVTGGGAKGSATVTVTTADGGKTAACIVSIPFNVGSGTEWTDALKAVSDANGGSEGSPKLFVLRITESEIYAEGKTAGSSIDGDYKEVWLTNGTGTIGTITRSSAGSLIRAAENQAFVIDGLALNGDSSQGETNTYPLVYIASGSAVELRKGAIGFNSNISEDTKGGGVHVDGGTFTMMPGGSITQNTATGSSGGGGVYVSSGTFTMKGGSIEGNTVSDGSNNRGGGVYVNSGGTFTMESGTIIGNTASDGGGVEVNGGIFTMIHALITYNTATGSFGGGGVHVNSGTFTMIDGDITENEATGGDGSGDGVYVNSGGTFTMEGGRIYRNTTSTKGGLYVSDDGTFNENGGFVQND
jgi:hypothetical protein